MKIIKSFLLVILLSFLLVNAYIIFMSNQTILRIWSPRTPYSTDPLEYDALAHHICFRSLYLSLVSDYKVGEIQGLIAERWETNNDKSEWTFYIRDNLFFSNNDLITPEDVAISLNRVAYVMKMKKSQSGLFEFLTGKEQLNSPINLASGIQFYQNRVTVKFEKPMPDLLTKIGFGLYGIVSRKDFNQTTGAWNNAKSINGSGAYVIEDWNENQLILSLRPQFPKILLLEKPIQQAIFSFHQNHIADSDLVVDFHDSLALGGEFKFYGPVKSAIRYVSCESWNDKNSICAEKSTRLRLRQQFYHSLSLQKFKFIKSFFPLAIEGIKEANISEQPSEPLDLKSKKVIVSKVNPAFKNSTQQSKLSPQEAFENSIQSIAKYFNFNVEVFTPPPNNPILGNVDIRFRMSAVLVDSPHHDIQFMFLSQQGIKLPDETGEIKQYIKSENFSVQKVNEMLWEQGIIWPINHMALGLWKKSDKVNLDSYNLILPPLDLQWIEWN